MGSTNRQQNNCTKRRINALPIVPSSDPRTEVKLNLLRIQSRVLWHHDWPLIKLRRHIHGDDCSFYICVCIYLLLIHRRLIDLFRPWEYIPHEGKQILDGPLEIKISTRQTDHEMRIYIHIARARAQQTTRRSMNVRERPYMRWPNWLFWASFELARAMNWDLNVGS